MSIVDKLLGRLTRRYDRSPAGLLGLRLSYLSGGMKWRIADEVLTTQVVGGIGVNLTVDLTQYTLSGLAVFLASQPGYVVLYLDGSSLSQLSALALVEGSGDINTSNGDHIFIATNANWALMSAYSAELGLARAAIEALPDEMATTTADGEWLDLLGSYYAVPRQLAEPDNQYSPRIPAEVILPRQNNVAIEMALQAATGQIATCTDAIVLGDPHPTYSAEIKFDGLHQFNTHVTRVFNLFDLSIGYAILGNTTPVDYLGVIRAQVDRLRAAGTHLHNLTLTGSVMGDRVTPPTDALVEHLQIASLKGVGTSFDSGLLAVAVLVGPATSADAGTAFLRSGAVFSGTFAGTSGLTSLARLQAQARVALSGTGQWAGAANTIQRSVASLSGSGLLLANPKHTPAAVASLAGAGQFHSTV